MGQLVDLLHKTSRFALELCFRRVREVLLLLAAGLLRLLLRFRFGPDSVALAVVDALVPR